jgi:hypothetical protein
MASDPYLDEDMRVLTPEAFEFVLTNELKRALRSQNFLTLLVVDAAPPGGTREPTPVTREITRLVSREIRETDLLSQNEHGSLSVVLLDADLEHAMLVVDRLLSRLAHYEFTTPPAIAVGAACCPTHGADVESLRRAAETRPVHPRRETRGNASNVQ